MMHKKEIDSKTNLCAVIGNPVEHSLSPAIHNASFAAIGLNWIYTAFCVKDIADAMRGIKALGIKGASITIPHKVEAKKYLDWIDPTAEKIGGINTVVNTDGLLKGYNTDGSGALKALIDSGCETSGKNILVIGSGGAARAIAFTIALQKTPERLSIAGIIENEVLQLCRDIEDKTGFKPESVIMEKGLTERRIDNTDIIIHCSPVGMYPDTLQAVISSEMFGKHHTVFDIVYNPLKTLLLKNAERAGAKTISGIEMFVNQAAFQFELWTERKAPFETMKKVLKKYFK